MAKEILVKVIGDVDDLNKKLGDATGDLKGFGKNVTKVLTPIGAAIAGVGVLAFKDWHAAMVTLESQTGDTGKRLEGLKDSLGDVGKQAPESLAEIADVMADVRVATGRTGDKLETLTDQFLDLKRMGVPATVDTVAQAFRRWDVKAKDLSGTLDLFFRAAQVSGISIDDLTESLAKFAPVLQGFGMSLPQAIALLAGFEKEGVPAAKAMTGLGKAFADWTTMGLDPQDMLKQTIEQIKKFKDPTDAAALAVQIFGKRAGPEMAKAIRDGNFNLDEMTKRLKDSKTTIDGTADSQETLNDKFKMFKNRVFEALGPYGEMMTLVGSGIAAIGPSIILVAELATAYKGLTAALKTSTFWQGALNIAVTANPYIAAVAALVIFITTLVILYKRYQLVRDITQQLRDKLFALTGVVIVLLGPLALVIAKFNDIAGAAKWARGKIEDFINWIKKIPTGPVGDLAAAFGPVISVIQTAISLVKTLIHLIQAIPSPSIPGTGGGTPTAPGPTNGNQLQRFTLPGLGGTGGGKGGGVAVSFNGPVYGNPQSIAQAVREEFVRMQRNGSKLGFT